MADSNHEVIIKNINQLIDATGLSDVSIADILNLSVRKLKYIKSGKLNLKLSDIELLANFFDVTVQSISKSSFRGHLQIRQQLVEKYKGKLEFSTHFEKTPSIAYAIRFSLVENPSFNMPMEVKEIKKALQKKGWTHQSSSI